MSNRKSSTDRSGRGFNLETRRAIWRKATPVFGRDPNVIRKDKCGASIRWSEYGNTGSKYGWEIDHIRPVSKGGSDSLANLQPLQWENNRHKSDSYPNWYCAVKAA